jgi:hypothetical protein
MSTHGLVSVSLRHKNPTKHLVQSGHHHHVIEMYINEKLLIWH